MTSDNASVNLAMMKHLNRLLQARGVEEFDPEQRRIGCLPHILHICVTKILKSVESRGKVPEDDDDDDGDLDDDDDSEDEDEDDEDDGDDDNIFKYLDEFPDDEDPASDKDEDDLAERRNPLGLLRKIIRTIRRSGDRRRAFRQNIITHNSTSSRLFPHSTKDIPVLELLRDVAIRWDSTYRMISRAFKLRPVFHSTH